MLRGIDISSWQEGINLRDVIVRNGLDFVVIKATEGTGFVEDTCDYWVQTCRSNGTLWGFYHFACHNEPEEEADYFYHACLNYFGEGIPVLDVETGQDGQWVQRFVDRLHALTGVYPIIYMSTGYVETMYGTQVPSSCGLWAAQYPYYAHGFDDIEFSDTIAPWQFAAMWQFTSEGELDGYSGYLDLDYAFMDREAWGKYADPEGNAFTAGQTTQLPSTSSLHTFEDDKVRVTVEVKHGA